MDEEISMKKASSEVDQNKIRLVRLYFDNGIYEACLLFFQKQLTDNHGIGKKMTSLLTSKIIQEGMQSLL